MSDYLGAHLYHITQCLILSIHPESWLRKSTSWCFDICSQGSSVDGSESLSTHLWIADTAQPQCSIQSLHIIQNKWRQSLGHFVWKLLFSLSSCSRRKRKKNSYIAHVDIKQVNWTDFLQLVSAFLSYFLNSLLISDFYVFNWT